MGAAVAQLLAVVNLVLLPTGGVAQNPVALLVWTFLILTLVAAVWTFLRSLLRRRPAATTAGPAQAARTPSAAAPRRRRRRRARAQRAEPERLGLWTRFLIRVGAVQLTTDAFQSLSPADRARYAGDKRYDPRYHAATTDAERRAFDRDRMQRVQARQARGGARDTEEPPTKTRRRALPDWMEVTQTTLGPATGVSAAEFDRLRHSREPVDIIVFQQVRDQLRRSRLAAEDPYFLAYIDTGADPDGRFDAPTDAAHRRDPRTDPGA